MSEQKEFGEDKAVELVVALVRRKTESFFASESPGEVAKLVAAGLAWPFGTRRERLATN